MKVLVTGGAGYIGSVVTHQLVDAGHRVAVLDDLSAGFAENIAAGAEFFQLPVDQVADVLTPDAGFEAVLHFAGKIQVAESVARPDLYWHTNVAGTMALLQAMRAAGTPRLIFSSTGSPNGSALASQLADCGAVVLGACLRNRMAVARWLASRVAARTPPPVIAVVAAGERWADWSLQPAIEDLWGAGAVISALADLGLTGLSPEARSAAAAFAAVAANLPAELAATSSGRELASIGFGQDVAVAAELDASASVPTLAGARLVDASRSPMSHIGRTDAPT